MTIEQNMIIGDAIKEGRNRLGLTQEQLGDELGYVKQTISNWEKGKNEVPDEAISKLNEVLNLNISKEALKSMEERKMRKMIKPLEEIDKFEDYSPVFNEVIRMIVGNENISGPYAIVLKKFLYVSATCALIAKKREEFEGDLWGILGYKLLTLINENRFEKVADVERSEGITIMLDSAKQTILDSYCNIYNIGEIENIVLEKKYEETLGEYSVAYIDDIKSILPKTENSFMTTMMVYLIETKRIIEQF